METYEKVEKLRERADVTYEEAKAALEANNWDLLDAMVALEKAGKTESPKKESYSTSFEQQDDYAKVQDVVEEQRNSTDKPHAGRTIGEWFRRTWDVIRANDLYVYRGDEELFRMPLVVLLVIFLIKWRITVIVLIVALFFGIRFRFGGRDRLEAANDFMEKTEAAAGKVKDSIKDMTDKKE